MEKIWLQSYEAGIEAEIDANRFQSIVDVFQQSVDKFGSKTAFQNMDATLSYAETGKLVTDFAAWLPV